MKKIFIIIAIFCAHIANGSNTYDEQSGVDCNNGDNVHNAQLNDGIIESAQSDFNDYAIHPEQFTRDLKTLVYNIKMLKFMSLNSNASDEINELIDTIIAQHKIIDDNLLNSFTDYSSKEYIEKNYLLDKIVINSYKLIEKIKLEQEARLKARLPELEEIK